MSEKALLRPAPVGGSPSVSVFSRLLLIATDWDKDLRVAAYAIQRSMQGGRLAVDVLYASAPIIAWQSLRFWAYGRVISWQREQGEQVLRAYYNRLAEAHIAAVCHVRIDEPAKTVPRLASEISAECVVLPTPPSELPPFVYWWHLHETIRASGTPVMLV